ncbi:MAG: helix-turn-helix transcriptional regulator, partial [Anaerolineae bacterium]
EMSEVSTDTLSRVRRLDKAALKRREVFGLLKDVGLAMSSLLGKSCEVVIHDLTDLEHSIIWIEGNVTGRRVGGMMGDLGLERLRKGEIHPLFNYTTYTESGKTLKSCSIWLRDSAGEIYGAFCINLDVTAIDVIKDFIGDLAAGSPQPDLSEAFSLDLNDMLDTMIAECEHRLAKPTKEMSRDERIEVVRFLEERGAFQVRNSAAVVADRLGVTRKTIYNYLSTIGRDAGEASTSG